MFPKILNVEDRLSFFCLYMSIIIFLGYIFFPPEPCHIFHCLIKFNISMGQFETYLFSSLQLIHFFFLAAHSLFGRLTISEEYNKEGVRLSNFISWNTVYPFGLLINFIADMYKYIIYSKSVASSHIFCSTISQLSNLKLITLSVYQLIIC